jgi:hypothetical protein
MAKKVIQFDPVAQGYYNPFFFAGRAQRSNAGENRTSQFEQLYFNKLCELSMSRFEWSGLPSSMDARFIEYCLLFYGLVVVFKDRNTDMIFAVRATPNGQLDMYDNPLQFTLSGRPFQGIQVKSSNCVPIWPNNMRTTDLSTIQVKTTTMAEIDRTIEINMRSARRTKILAYDENTRLSVENVNRMIDNGDAVIPISTSLDIKTAVQSIDLGIHPDTIENLSIVRSRIWNETMGLLGINNSNQDKKERLVSDEVDANNDQVYMARESALTAREKAAERINEMFDLNVSVSYSNVSADIPGIDYAPMQEIGGE